MGSYSPGPYSVFSPMFLFPSEYTLYGIPSSSAVSDIDNLVQVASTMIDEHCGRQDGTGVGSLVVTTYQQRLVSESLSRNIYYIPQRPLCVVTPQMIAAWQQLNAGTHAYNQALGVTGDYFYTGCLPSINILANGNTSAIIAASGRYAYGRRSSYRNDPWDISATISPVGGISLQAGPSQWITLDMVNLDYDPVTGEIWFSDTSLIGVNYNEVVITYNAGYDPTQMPKQIKIATAAIVKNLLAKGGGTTGMTSFTSSKAGVAGQFDPNCIDQNVRNILQSFVTTRMY